MSSEEALPGLLSGVVAADPYGFYKRLRHVAPVHFDESANAYLLSKHADVSAAYRHPAFTTKNYEWQLEPVFGRGLLQMDGVEHSRTRALLTPYFRGAGLDVWSDSIDRNVAEIIDGSVDRVVGVLLDPIDPGTEFDFLDRFAHLLPVFVIAEMLSLPKADYLRFWDWYSAMIAFLSNLGGDAAVHQSGILAARELREYLTPIISQRRESPGTDLISALIKAEIDGQSLNDDQIKTHVTQLLTAGSETTDKTLGNLFAHLLMDRSRYEEVLADRTLVIPALSETLRVTPPSQMNGRVLSEDVEVRDRAIPAGSMAYLIIASANRDEERFYNSETFDMHRTDVSHTDSFSARGEIFAFGHGRHFCLGAMLARAELVAGLNSVLDRFPALRIAPGFEPMEAGLKMRAPTQMRLVA